jgi:hypothetical protein
MYVTHRIDEEYARNPILVTYRTWRIVVGREAAMYDLARAPKQIGTLIRRSRKRLDGAFASLEAELPADFPQVLHDSVSAGVQHRMRILQAGLDDASGRDA